MQTNTRFLYKRDDFVFPNTWIKIAGKNDMSIQLIAIDRFQSANITWKTIPLFNMARQNDSYKLNSL